MVNKKYQSKNFNNEANDNEKALLLDQDDLAKYLFKEPLEPNTFSLIDRFKDSDDTLKQRLKDVKFFIDNSKIRNFRQYLKEMDTILNSFTSIQGLKTQHRGFKKKTLTKNVNSNKRVKLSK